MFSAHMHPHSYLPLLLYGDTEGGSWGQRTACGIADGMHSTLNEFHDADAILL